MSADAKRDAAANNAYANAIASGKSTKEAEEASSGALRQYDYNQIENAMANWKVERREQCARNYEAKQSAIAHDYESKKHLLSEVKELRANEVRVTGVERNHDHDKSK